VTPAGFDAPPPRTASRATTPSVSPPSPAPPRIRRAADR
jgi:hypothetical protein